MKVRSVVTSTFLSVALLIGSNSVFAEEAALPFSACPSFNMLSSEGATQVDWYEWTGELRFTSYPPSSTSYNDGRGYVGRVHLQFATKDPQTNVWIGCYSGLLYYQY